MKLMKHTILASLFAIAPLAAATVHLETATGSALTLRGGEVRSAPYTGSVNQQWTAGPGGTWISMANPRLCLAFESSLSDAYTVRDCGGLFVYRSGQAESNRGLMFHPVRGAAVDTSNRDAVLAYYNAQYPPANPPTAIGFTGDVSACSPGTTSPDFRAAVARRLNFFRNMAGLADVALDDTLSTQAQSSALMQAANNMLSHTPPSTWTCYSDVGAAASGKSNLFLGLNGWDAVTGYIDESGVLGHRRWVIFPGLQRFGTGDIPAGANSPASNALYVITGDPVPDGLTTRDGFVAWPPKGFVPYKFAYGTWSFAVPQADFSQAALTITDGNGANVAFTGQGQLDNGYGDNTYAFQPTLPNTLAKGGKAGPRPAPGGPDLAYTVAFTNVMVGGVATNYTYTVTLIDVNDPITDITLFIASISSLLASGATVGQLQAVDPNPDPSPTLTFTLVAGDGSDDNASFSVNGANLNTAAPIDFSQKPTWKIRVRADNGHANGTFEKAIVIAPFAPQQ